MPTQTPTSLETPALSLWHKRMAMGYKGQRPEAFSTWVYDNLWRAACWEAQAVALSGQGYESLAEDCLAEAKHILLQPEGQR